MTNEKVEKSGKKWHCSKCDYTTSKKSHWVKHIETKKHKRLTIPNMVNNKIHICVCGKEYKHASSLSAHKNKCKFIKNQDDGSEMVKNGKNMVKNGKCPKMSFSCICGKTYKYQAGLSRHKSTCTYKENSLTVVEANTTNDVMKLVKELLEKNEDLVEKYTELAEKPTTNITNNTQFNVMNYLNTECSDAMNLSDFVDQFEFSLKDLDLLQSKGYQEAMERTFVKQLCDMEKTKRPIHCSDKKRKSFYVKDNNVWEKDQDNKKLIVGVQKLSSIHNRALSKWRSYNVDWSSNDKKQDFFNKSVQEFTKCDHEKEQNKIFVKLTKLSVK